MEQPHLPCEIERVFPSVANEAPIRCLNGEAYQKVIVVSVPMFVEMIQELFENPFATVIN
jgi:hypothetical protein